MCDIEIVYFKKTYTNSVIFNLKRFICDTCMGEDGAYPTNSAPFRGGGDDAGTFMSQQRTILNLLIFLSCRVF